MQEIGQTVAGPGLARDRIVVARHRPAFRDTGGKTTAPTDLYAAPGMVAHGDHGNGAEGRAAATSGKDRLDHAFGIEVARLGMVVAVVISPL
jgi:hypothetical protein